MTDDRHSAATSRRRRILFIAEAATLAHVARPYALARGLDAAKWDVVFACADSYLQLFPQWPWPREPIHSLPPRTFMNRLARGNRLYSLAELKRYAADDLRLLDRVRPDVVVGDFRLSLSASARIARVPYVALTNAYWSPYALHRRVPTPSLPMTRYVGVPIASTLFALARPVAFAWHALPLNLLRKGFGLPVLGLDLRRVYTDADITLYADVPELVPTCQLPPNHRYIGPVEWAPCIPVPELPVSTPDRPLIYVTLGSSGTGGLLPTILDALATVECHVAVATAGTPLPHLPHNVTAADYLPGDRLCESASLVICNGGSPTSHQALARGVPVLGIPFNLDQHLNMEHVAASGAGLSLRPEHACVANVRSFAVRLLRDHGYKDKAERLSRIFGTYDPARELERAIGSLP